jgi:hypothetical protein
MRWISEQGKESGIIRLALASADAAEGGEDPQQDCCALRGSERTSDLGGSGAKPGVPAKSVAAGPA